MIKTLLSFLAFIACVYPISAQVGAKFSASECAKEIYRNGFDDAKDVSTWTLTTTNSAYTWHLASKPRINGIPEFSSINPASKNSLVVWYDDTNFAAQDESLKSPKMVIPNGSNCSFYACFDGVYVMYADFKLIVTEEDGTATTIFDAFLWSQESGHERPKWAPINLDLSKFGGKTVTFTFSYSGRGGDDVLVDDFIISQPDLSDESRVEIKEGEQVHFIDASTGNPTSWEWSFMGADVETSTEQNPVVTYSKAGEYAVTLKVTDGTTENSATRSGFVTVRGMAPTAIIGLPQEGYLSPWAACFIPKNTLVSYTDKSVENPTEWFWQLPGSSSATSTEQNPQVSYSTEGVYSVGMRATNSIGTHTDQYDNAIQVGGKQNIWNIEMNESDQIASIYLGFYGYYGGSNWLDMPGFAEYFHKPVAEGEISAVDIFFASVTTITPDAEIVVSVVSPKDGLPGAILGSSKLKVSELKYEEGKYLSTRFTFDNIVSVKDDFFITITGIPSNASETSYDADDIAMYCSPKREDGGKSTVYHQLAILDENYLPTGETEWVKNTDEFLSFAIAPMFEYKNGSGIETSEATKTECNILVADEMLQIRCNGELAGVNVFNVSGQLIHSTVSNNISISDWAKGIYIVKAIVDGKPFVTKVKI